MALPAAFLPFKIFLFFTETTTWLFHCGSSTVVVLLGNLSELLVFLFPVIMTWKYSFAGAFWNLTFQLSITSCLNSNITWCNAYDFSLLLSLSFRIKNFKTKAETVFNLAKKQKPRQATNPRSFPSKQKASPISWKKILHFIFTNIEFFPTFATSKTSRTRTRKRIFYWNQQIDFSRCLLCSFDIEILEDKIILSLTAFFLKALRKRLQESFYITNWKSGAK